MEKKKITIKDIANNLQCRDLVHAYNMIKMYFGKFFKTEGAPILYFSTGTANCFEDLKKLPGVSVIDTADYVDLGIPVPCIEGHSAKLHLLRILETPVFFSEGRVQLSDGFTPAEVVLLTRALGLLGVKKSIFINASGTVNLEEYKPGDFVLVSDHINFSGQSPLCGREAPFFEGFTDLAKVYNICLQKVFKEVAKSKNIKIKDGAIYGLTKTAKEFETPTEVRMFKMLGVDLLGMSSVLEAIACVNMGVDVALLSVVTNEGVGLGSSVSHEENLQAIKNCGKDLAQLMFQFTNHLEMVAQS